MRRFGLGLLPGVLLVFAIGSGASAQDAGQIGWGSEIAHVVEARCGFSADDFVMNAQSEGMRLRLAFRGEGTEESVDFGDVSSVDLSFIDAHAMRGQQFRMSSSLGDMGEITAGPDHAVGRLHLRPASAQALDAQPDGLTITYDFRCTAEYF